MSLVLARKRAEVHVLSFKFEFDIVPHMSPLVEHEIVASATLSEASRQNEVGEVRSISD